MVTYSQYSTAGGLGFMASSTEELSPTETILPSPVMGPSKLTLVSVLMSDVLLKMEALEKPVLLLSVVLAAQSNIT